MNTYYQLTTGTVFCSKTPLKFLANGLSEPIDGFLSISG